MCFLLLVTACAANQPVEFVIALLVCVEVMRGQDLYLVEVIILRSLGKGNGRRGGVLVGAPLPLAYVVTALNGICKCCKGGNLGCIQGLTEIGVDGHGLDQVAVQIVEVYSIQILLVVDCVVGEVVGGEYQALIALGNNGLLDRTVRTYVVNVAVELGHIILERNSDGSLAAVELRADQVKAIYVVVSVEVLGGGPFCLFTDHVRDLEEDLVSGCVCLDVEQCSVVEYDLNGVCACAVACNDCLQSNVTVHLGKLKNDIENGCGSGPTVAVLDVFANGHDEGAAVQGYTALGVKVRLFGVFCKVICMSNCLCKCCAVCCIPALEGVRVGQIHLLGGCCGSGGQLAVLNFNGSDQRVACEESDGCIQISLVGCVSGCGNDCGIPALEGQDIGNCLNPSSLGSGSFTVRNFNLVCLISYDKGNVSGVFCYVSSVTGNCGQLKAVACPTLEVQGIKQVQILCQRGDLAVCEGLGVDLAEHVEGNGELVSNLLDRDYGIGCGHGGQHVTVLIHSYQLVALTLQIRIVRSKLCAVRQEALEDLIALFVHELNRVQVCKGNAEGNVGGDVTGGNVIAKRHTSAESSNGYLVQYVLDPCTGVIGLAECKAEYAVALVGIGQLGILELFGDLVVDQVDGVADGVKRLLCLCGIGDSVLVVGKRLNHAHYDILCAGGADVQSVCNALDSCVQTCAANQSVCILELGQSCKILKVNKLGQFVYLLDGEGSLSTLDRFGSLVDQNICIILEQIHNGTGLTDSVVESSDCTHRAIVCLFSLSRLGNAVLEIRKHFYHALYDCLCAIGADADRICHAGSCSLQASAANQSICILELRHSSQIVVADRADQIVDRLGGNAVDRIGQLFHQKVTVLLEEVKCGVRPLHLVQDRKLVSIQRIKTVKYIFHDVDKLLIIQLIQQSQQLANRCAFTKACNDDLLGLVRNACVVECLSHNLGQRTGNSDLYVQVAAGRDGIINYLNKSLGSVADQIKITLEGNVELNVKILLAVSTQRDVVSADHTVIFHISDVVGRDQVGQQRVLDAGGGNDLTVVACLHGVEQLDKLACTVAVNAEHLVAVDVDGVGLTVVHVQRGGLQEGNNCFLIYAGRTAASYVTQHVSQDLVVVTGGHVDVQSCHAVYVGHLVLTVVHGHAVDVSNDLFHDIHGLTVHGDVLFGHEHVIHLPGYVLACAHGSNRGLLDHLLIRVLLRCNDVAVQLPGYGISRLNVFFASLLSLSLVLLDLLLMLYGVHQVVYRSTVLHSVHDVVDAAEVVLNDLTAGQNVLPALLDLCSVEHCGPDLGVSACTLNAPVAGKGVGIVLVVCLYGTQSVCKRLDLALILELENAVTAAGHEGYGNGTGSLDLLNGIESNIGSVCLCGHDDGRPTLERVLIIGGLVAERFDITGEHGGFAVRYVGNLDRSFLIDLPGNGEGILENVIDDVVHAAQRIVASGILTDQIVCGFLKTLVAFVLFLDVVLHLVSSILVILDLVILLEQIHQEAEIASCEIRRKSGNSRCSERGNVDYRDQQCKAKHCNKNSATHFCGLLHWSFLQLK